MSNRVGPYLLLKQEREERVIPVPPGILRVGRSPRNELCLPDRSVSRFHCFLARQGDEVRVYDAASDNGCRVGKEKAADGKLLGDGDVLSLGRHEVVFRSGKAVSLAAPDSAPKTGEAPGRPFRIPRSAFRGSRRSSALGWA